MLLVCMLCLVAMPLLFVGAIAALTNGYVVSGSVLFVVLVVDVVGFIVTLSLLTSH